MTDLLKLEPGVLRGKANDIDSMVGAMAEYFDKELRSLQGTDWHGAAGDAYKDMFTEARRSFKGVEDNLRGCAALLRSIAAGFEDTDANAARQVAAGGR